MTDHWQDATDLEAHRVAPAPPTTPELQAAADRRRLQMRPIHRSQQVVLWWCLWLIGSWGLLWVESSAAAARWMIFSAIVGLMVLWPALRLSQELAARSTLSARTYVLIDWLSLHAVFQVVIWPLRLYGDWGMRQTLWLLAALAAWSLLTALIIAWATRASAPDSALATPHRQGLRRLIAMAACLLLLLGEPMMLWLLDTLGQAATLNWQLRITPLPVLWELTQPRLDWLRPQTRWTIITVALAAVAGWIVLASLFPRSARAARMTLPSD